MRGRAFDVMQIPASFWQDSVLLDALADRDVGQLFRLVQKVSQASQTQIGIATGLSQAQVSEIMSRARRVSTIEVLARIVNGLGIPEPARTVLFLGDRSQATTGRPAVSSAPNTKRYNDGADPARFGDVTAVYASRSEFMSAMPPHTLLDTAKDIRIAGLSLNLICQQYADTKLISLLESGTRIRCLFLDPEGDAIKAREREEGHPGPQLRVLTEMNIQLLRRVRDRLPADKRDCLALGTYDQTIRFNVVLVDKRLCIAQPYLPTARGVESPTVVIEQRTPNTGLYATFEEIFATLWKASRPL
ncbi:XRE family transcriptional regulator [Dactylosporangium aurantiacum]|uniref:XRE family transcriptional regulator n=1 Tax=Dactylosporangium aurantiacum TaxID=35754 RepID=A0A9Q9ISU4_9ACTN|nr:DUF5919 domain-containing protein [Dactylosporangium aurantiacum]MDG6107611.1 DUF5919 domain-containing protein [Dactylosporangium aurantiacum]UWZ58789.1 XRE family transcriptional regulator [Dactylosporangium aurantiacum]